MGHGALPEGQPRIQRLIGVYNANGTLRGELTYWIGARLGRAHCSLCDVTHGSVRKKPAWAVCRAGLPVAFDTYHLDDQPPAVRRLLAGAAPAVIADTDGGLVLLLAADELASCDGSPERLVASVDDAAARLGLRWR